MTFVTRVLLIAVCNKVTDAQIHPEPSGSATICMAFNEPNATKKEDPLVTQRAFCDYIAIFFEVRPIHACTLVPLWHVRATSGNRRGIALATQGAHSVTAVSCPPDPCKKNRHLPSR